MGGKKDAAGHSPAVGAFLKWARDKKGVKKFQRELNLAQMLGMRPNSMARGTTTARRERGKGVLVRLENVLPLEVFAFCPARGSASKYYLRTVEPTLLNPKRESHFGIGVSGVEG